MDLELGAGEGGGGLLTTVSAAGGPALSGEPPLASTAALPLGGRGDRVNVVASDSAVPVRTREGCGGAPPFPGIPGRKCPAQASE